MLYLIRATAIEASAQSVSASAYFCFQWNNFIKYVSMLPTNGRFHWVDIRIFIYIYICWLCFIIENHHHHYLLSQYWCVYVYASYLHVCCCCCFALVVLRRLHRIHVFSGKLWWRVRAHCQIQDDSCSNEKKKKKKEKEKH